MSSQFDINNSELDTPLKQRLYQLMTEDEKQHPFSFASRIGINKSTFHNIWTKGSNSIHRSTAKKIANATGVNVEWLHKGISQPHESSSDESDQKYPNFKNQLFMPSRKPRTVEELLNDNLEMRMYFNLDYIADALDIIDQVVEASDVHISNQTKAELIVQICSAMNSPDGEGVKKAVSTVLKLIKAS